MLNSAFFRHKRFHSHRPRKAAGQAAPKRRSLRVEPLEAKLCLSLPGFYGVGMVTSDSDVYYLEVGFETGTLTPHHLGTLTYGGSTVAPARDDAVRPGFPAGSFLCVADNPSDPLGLPSMLRGTDIDVFQQDVTPATEIPVTNLGELWMENPLQMGPETLDVRLNALEWAPALSGAEPLLIGAGYAGISGTPGYETDMVFLIDPVTFEATPIFDLDSIGAESAGEITFDPDLGVYLSLVGGDIFHISGDAPVEPFVFDLPSGTPDFDALLPYFDDATGTDLVGITPDHDYYGINLLANTVEFLGTLSHTNPDWLDSEELIYGTTVALEDPLDAGTVSGVVNEVDIAPRLGQLWYKVTAGSTAQFSVDLLSGSTPGSWMMLYHESDTNTPIASGHSQVTTSATANETFYLHVVDLEHNGSVDLQFNQTTVSPETSLDIDGNDSADALTDGIVILRYLFGFTGDPLVNNAVAPDATRTDPTEIAAALDASFDSMLDVDASGNADALTDGILILRYLFGFSGDSLVENALSMDATRTDPTEVAAFLDGWFPTTPLTSPDANLTDAARDDIYSALAYESARPTHSSSSASESTSRSGTELLAMFDE